MSKPSKNLPLLSALLLCAVAVATGGLLTASSSKTGGTDTGSIYILGPARALLSASLYQRADQYFHKGVKASKEEAFKSFFQKWHEALNPTEHLHAEATEILEIMPWLRLATQSDPHNIEAYLVAVFWLNGEINRPDLALEVIDEALLKNPGRYEIYLEKGRTLLTNDQLDLAAEAFDTTLTLLTEKKSDDPEQAQIDLSLIFSVQSYLYEAQNNREKAITAAENHQQLNPDKQHAAERLAHLQSEPLNPEAAKIRLQELFSNTYVCSSEEHEHDEHCGCGDAHEEPKPDEHVHGPSCNHD